MVLKVLACLPHAGLFFLVSCFLSLVSCLLPLISRILPLKRLDTYYLILDTPSRFSPFLLLERVAGAVVLVLDTATLYQYNLPIAGAPTVAAKQAIGSIWDDLVHRFTQNLADKQISALASYTQWAVQVFRKVSDLRFPTANKC